MVIVYDSLHYNTLSLTQIKPKVKLYLIYIIIS